MIISLRCGCSAFSLEPSLSTTAVQRTPKSPPTLVRRRRPTFSLLAAFQEHWLDSEAQQECLEQDVPLGEAIAEGEVVLCLPNVATTEECKTLLDAGLQACEESTEPSRGRSRFSVSDPDVFSNDIVLLCEEILLRVMDVLDEHVPSIYVTLFKPSKHWCEWQPLNAQLEEPTVPPLESIKETCDSLRDLYVMSELEWSEGEPAINVYQTQGYFGCHKDHLALTVLIPLTSSQEFKGGGTGFWCGNRETSENPSNKEPTCILKPPPGSALVFGGDVTHSGMPVEDGYRSVCVCSFSTKTPASSPGRLHGLHAAPKTTANFKGA